MEDYTLEKIETDLSNLYEEFIKQSAYANDEPSAKVLSETLTKLFSINMRVMNWLKMDRQIIDDFDEVGSTLTSYDLLDEESKDALDHNIIEQWERQQEVRARGEVLAYNEMDYLDLQEVHYLAAKARVKARTEARKLTNDFTQDEG